MSITRKLFYAIAFQAGWFFCILAGNWISLAYAVIFLTIHFWLLAQDRYFSLRKEIYWIGIVAIGGLILETISFSAAFLLYGESAILFEYLALPPLWLLNLWIIFAIALRTCLSFIFYNPKITYLSACLCIPLNYYAGAKLNNHVNISEPYTLSLATITLMWLILLRVLIHLKRHYFEDIFNAG